MDATTLQAFSQLLLRLTGTAQNGAPAQLVREALWLLRPLVPFRSAWWGECSDGQAEQAPRNWLHGRIHLPASFAAEWNQLAAGDVFARNSMQALGSVLRDSGDQDPDPAVRAFVQRHDLFHAMAITLELPGSGLLFFVSLYRGREAPAFDDTEALLFAEFSRHLLLHWHGRIQQQVQAAMSRSSDGFGLADAQGQLLYLGQRLGTLLHRAHPDWSGTSLPPPLAQAQGRVPCSLPLGRQQLTLQACGDLLALTLEPAGRSTPLAPRERSAALLYAQGHSYKEIARLLALSPATVRTYLRQAYLQLGVRNKVELGQALRAPAARRKSTSPG